jgi:hypothetical protein
MTLLDKAGYPGRFSPGPYRTLTGERGMARLLSPFGLQWIRGCEAVDTKIAALKSPEHQLVLAVF